MTGLLRRRRPFGLAVRPGFLRSCAALSAIPALTAHLSWTHRQGELGIAALALCALMAVLHLGAALSKTWALRTAFLAAPGTAAVLLNHPG